MTQLHLDSKGTGSYAELVEYVTAVLRENFVPTEEHKVWPGDPNERSARAIVYSVLHRLEIQTPLTMKYVTRSKMRFRTIWTIPAMTFGQRLRRTRDWAAQTVAAKLPLRIRYWVTLQEIGHATKNSEDVPATPLDEILQNLATPKSMS